MRKITILLLTLVFVLSASFAYAAPHEPTEPYAKVFQGALIVKAGAVKAGESITASGSGFKPGESVSVFWNGVFQFAVTADGKGSVSFEFVIPIDAKAGIHTLSAEGPTTKPAGAKLVLSRTIVVKDDKVAVLGVKEKAPEAGEVAVLGTKVQPQAKESSMLPMTGGALLWALLIMGLALTLTGFGIKVVKKD